MNNEAPISPVIIGIIVVGAIVIFSGIVADMTKERPMRRPLANDCYLEDGTLLLNCFREEECRN